MKIIVALVVASVAAGVRWFTKPCQTHLGTTFTFPPLEG